jgi:hypothetical protein
MTTMMKTIRGIGAMGLMALLTGCVAPAPYNGNGNTVVQTQPTPYYAAEPYYDPVPVYPAYYDPYPYGVASIGFSVYGGRYYDDDYYHYKPRKGKKRRYRDSRARRGDFNTVRSRNSGTSVSRTGSAQRGTPREIREQPPWWPRPPLTGCWKMPDSPSDVIARPVRAMMTRGDCSHDPKDTSE